MRWLWMAGGLILLIVCTFSSAAAAGPSLTVLTPADGQVIEGDTVSVVFQASNFNIVPSTVPLSEAGKHPEVNRPGEGHVHLMLDLGPLVVWYQSTPYTFNNVAPGQHQLMVELVNNDHSSLSPRVMQMIQFKIQAPQAATITGGGPSLSVFTPRNGQTINAMPGVTVVFQASNFNIVPSTVPLSEAGKHPEVNRPGEGHVHLMLDLGPLVVWYQSTPYTFNNIAPGQHQLMVELVNNDHSSLSPRVMQMIQFQFGGPGLPVTGKGSAPPLGAYPLLVLGVLVIATGGLVWGWAAFHLRW